MLNSIALNITNFQPNCKRLPAKTLIINDERLFYYYDIKAFKNKSTRLGTFKENMQSLPLFFGIFLSFILNFFRFGFSFFFAFFKFFFGFFACFFSLFARFFSGILYFFTGFIVSFGNFVLRFVVVIVNIFTCFFQLIFNGVGTFLKINTKSSAVSTAVS